MPDTHRQIEAVRVDSHPAVKVHRHALATWSRLLRQLGIPVEDAMAGSRATWAGASRRPKGGGHARQGVGRQHRAQLAGQPATRAYAFKLDGRPDHHAVLLPRIG